MTESVAAGESQPNSNNNINNNGELLSVPRGGPIYVANLVGSLTSVPYFQSSLLLELQNLEVELSSDSTQVPEEDISVEELKIFTEEELVDMAMKEAFKEGEEADNASALPEELSIEGRKDDNGMSNDEDACLENSGRGRDSAETNCNGTSSKNKLKKRKRRIVHNHTVEEGEEAGNASALPEVTFSEGRKDDNGISNDKDACLENSGSGRDSAKTNCNGTSSKDKLKKRKRRMVHNHTVEEGKDTNNPSAISEEPSIEGRKDDHGISNDEDVCLEISGKGRNGSAENGCNRTVRNKNMKKQNTHDHSVEIRYIEKVEQLAKIKKKQDEDKASVTLHSFNRAIPSSEKSERMKLLRSANAAAKVKSSSFQEHIAVTYPEVALSIEVYHNIKKWVKTHEFLVLGRQTLTELRDKIYCLTDQVMQKAGQHDPSGYFLIEDVFCNDLRNPSAIDYSEPIFDWLQNNKEEALKKWECIISGDLQRKQKAVMGDATVLKVPNFKAVNMHQTRFSDLKFHLGAGYLYCHQGNCKHTIVFRDMRLIHPEDVQNKAAYPIVLFQMKPRVQKCYVCNIYRATKVTVDDKWARDNPCYFCDDCYYLLHYKDGSLLYSDFSVYDYLQD